MTKLDMVTRRTGPTSDTSLPIQPASAPSRDSAVNLPLTLKRRKREVEGSEYGAFIRRVIRALSRRVAAGDVDALQDLAALADQVDQAVTEAVAGLRARGYSWTEIGDRLGISKQGAQQRWGK